MPRLTGAGSLSLLDWPPAKALSMAVGLQSSKHEVSQKKFYGLQISIS